jgi:hypothetical protein
MSPRRGPTVHRLPALLGILAVVAGLVAVSQAGHPFHPSVHVVAAPVSGPAAPPADAVSSTWYCAEGTSIRGGRADETVIIANLNRRAITATVTVMPGSGRTPASRRVLVDALGQRRVAVSSIRATAQPGVIVEALTGAVVVEHELTRGSDSTVGPCARQASQSWYFAAGDTTAGMEDWLALFNPFADDAIVDLTFLTPQGVESPLAGQAIVVPRHSRVSVPLQQVIRDQGQLAVMVHARLGRLVAEQSLYSDGSNGPPGLTTTVGATGPAPRWQVPTVDGGSGASATLEVANFSNTSTHVTVGVTLDNDASLPAQRLSVPSMTVSSVNLSQRVVAGTGYSVRVRGPAAVPVVVELVQTWAAPAAPPGLAATLGTTATASHWAFATGRTDDSGDAQLVVVNLSGRPLSVELLAFTPGDPNSPTSAPAQAVGAGKRAVFSLSADGVDPDQVLVVQANGSIVAGREVMGPSRSLSVGIPELP